MMVLEIHFKEVLAILGDNKAIADVIHEGSLSPSNLCIVESCRALVLKIKFRSSPLLGHMINCFYLLIKFKVNEE